MVRRPWSRGLCLRNGAIQQQHAPDCKEVFAKFFSRDQTIRPDIERVVKQPVPVDAVSALEPDRRAQVQSQIQAILSDTVDEWHRNLDVAGTPSFSWIEAFDRRYDRATIQQVIDAANPSEIGNEYVRPCVQFGVVLSAVLRQERPTGLALWPAILGVGSLRRSYRVSSQCFSLGNQEDE